MLLMGGPSLRKGGFLESGVFDKGVSHDTESNWMQTKWWKRVQDTHSVRMCVCITSKMWYTFLIKKKKKDKEEII